MAYNYEYPYVDPHRYNADWILKEVKRLVTEFARLDIDFVELKTYVMDYFKNLDLTQEVSDKIEQMYEDGVLEDILLQTYAKMYYVPAVDKHIFFFGDSWTYGNDGQGGYYNKRFSQVVEDKTGMISHNFGVGGIGFIKTMNNETLKDHIDAVAANPLVTDYPDFIVIMCGFNDVNHLGETYGGVEITLSGIYAAAQAALVAALGHWPGARIIWMGCDMKCQQITPNERQAMNYVTNAASVFIRNARGVVSVSQNWIWKLIGKTQYYNNDKVHPSVEGHQIIANSIINTIYGGENNYALIHSQINSGNGIWSGQVGVDNTNYFVEQTNDMVTVHFPIIKFSTEPSLSSPLESSITLPNAVCPNSPQVVPAYSGTNNILQVAIFGNGKIYLKKLAGTDSLANVNIYIPDVNYKMYSHI